MSTIRITSVLSILLGVVMVFMLTKWVASSTDSVLIEENQLTPDLHCFSSGSFCFTLPREFFDLDESADPLEGISLQSKDGSIYLKLREYSDPSSSLRNLFDTKYQDLKASTKVFYIGKVFLNDEVDQLSAEFAMNNLYYYYLVKDLGPTIVEVVIFGADKGREAVLKAAMGINVSQKMASAQI